MKLDDCVFCRIALGTETPEAVAHQDGETLVFPSLHQRPANQGHMIVVPVKHVRSIYVLPPELGGPLMTTLASVARAVKRAFAADGVSIRQNNDPAGDQDVFHLHVHVIPRYEADGFNHGDDRFPLGLVEITLAERVDQASMLRSALRGG